MHRSLVVSKQIYTAFHSCNIWSITWQLRPVELFDTERATLAWIFQKIWFKSLPGRLHRNRKRTKIPTNSRVFDRQHQHSVYSSTPWVKASREWVQFMQISRRVSRDERYLDWPEECVRAPQRRLHLIQRKFESHSKSLTRLFISGT